MNDFSAVLAESVDLSGGWDKVWSALQNALGTGLTTLMTMLGVIIVVLAIGKWIWDRRRGGGGSSSALWGALAVGVLLAAPGIVIPFCLTIADAVANFVVNLFTNSGA